MTPEQDSPKDDKPSDAPSVSSATEASDTNTSTSDANMPKLPVNSKKSEETEPSERPAVTPVNINLPIVSPKKSNLKTIIIIVLSIALMAVIGFGIYTLLSMNQNATNSAQSKDNENTQTSNAQLKAAVTVLDGKAMYSKDGTAWVDLTTSIVLSQGDFVQTQSDSLVMLTVDDGSVIRMNAATTIELAELTPNSIVVTNLAGDVYTRVAKSDNRTFTVNVDETEYKALGTAYMTTNTEEEKGVQVYESSVQVGEDGVKVEEGKQFFEKHKDSKKVKKVTEVPVDELTSDGFILWNLEQDKKDKQHKEHLGYLKKIEEKRKVNPEEGQKPRPKPNDGNSQGDASTDAITLTGSENSKGAYLTWTASGVSGHDGFKVVRSKEDSTPTYGHHEAHFVGADAREHKWHDGSGKTFYYRVCVYKAGVCSDYSNTVQVKSPYSPPPQVVSGPVTLSNTGATVLWSIEGTAPHGFKLLLSRDNNAPTYPNNSKFYVDKHASSFNLAGKVDDGTYYVRICKYTASTSINGGCMNYSNTIQVTVP